MGSSYTCLTAVSGPAFTIGFVSLEDVCSNGCGCADTLLVSNCIDTVAKIKIPNILKKNVV